MNGRLLLPNSCSNLKTKQTFNSVSKSTKYTLYPCQNIYGQLNKTIINALKKKSSLIID